MNKRYLVLSCVWFMASVYVLFFKVPSNAPQPFEHFDKVVHAALFFVQAYLMARIWLNVAKPIPVRLIIRLLFAWAVLSELGQHYLTQNRQGDVWDVVADTVGIFAALYLAHQVEKHRQKNQNDSINV